MLTELLADALARSSIVAGLGLDGAEVEEYARRHVSGWEVRDGRAEVTVRFGPFPKPVEFNEVLFISDFGVERLQLAGRIRIPQGVAYEHTTGVTIRG